MTWPRRTLVMIGAVIAAVVLTATVAALVLRDDDGSAPSSSASTPASSPSASPSPSPTAVVEQSIKVCPATNGPGITGRPILQDPAASVTVDERTTLRFALLAAHVQELGPGRWRLLVTTRMTNDSAADLARHASYRYRGVAVAGTPYPLACFGIVDGQEVLGVGMDDEAVLGVELSENPTGELTLLLDNGPQLTFASAP